MLKTKVAIDKYTVERFLKEEFGLALGENTNIYSNGGGVYHNGEIIFPKRRKDVCVVHHIKSEWSGRNCKPLMSDGHRKEEKIFVVWVSNDSLKYTKIGIKYHDVCLIFYHVGQIKTDRNKISIEIKRTNFPDNESKPSSVEWVEVNINESKSSSEYIKVNI